MNALHYPLVPLCTFLLFMWGFTATAQAQEVVSQSVDLASGWNIVSTPMILSSHDFSVDETSENFDIYVLDASKPTGWATMSDLGQTEFTPLFGYFINNKTDEYQTLTFNYDTTVDPNNKLFERTFSAEGWYSIGVANAEYSKTLMSDREDTNNPNKILSLLAGKYDLVIDFTDGVYDYARKSVALTDPWKAVIPVDIDELNDFRDTKGYAVYIKESSARYNGFQNDAVEEQIIAEELLFSLSASNPETSAILVEEDTVSDRVTVLEYTIQAQYGDVDLGELWVNLQTGTENLEHIIEGVTLVVDGKEYQNDATGVDVTSADFAFAIDGGVGILEGESVTVQVLVNFKPQVDNYANYGETIQAQVTEELVGQTVSVGIDAQLGVGQLMGSAIGDIHTLMSGGLIVEAGDTSTDTQGENDTTGIFTIEFNVTAFEGDAYIKQFASTTADSGVEFAVEGPVNPTTISAVLSSTGDEDTSGVFTVREGETETFTLTVAVDASVAGQHRVILSEINYSENTDGLNAETYLPIPSSDFRTDYLNINAS